MIFSQQTYKWDNVEGVNMEKNKRSNDLQPTQCGAVMLNWNSREIREIKYRDPRVCYDRREK